MAGEHCGGKLSAFHHGELRQAERAEVILHLAACERCRAEYDEVRAGAGFAEELRTVEPPEGLWREVERALDSRPGSGMAFQWARMAVACGLLVGVCGWLLSVGTLTQPGWAVTSLSGEPEVGGKRIGASGELGVGQWLVTDGGSQAQVRVGEIGEVTVEGNSRLRLVASGKKEHRLALERGKMSAFIWAPPRQFFVDTPSAVAVDLGCAYTLEVSAAGEGVLHVTSGWVAFEWKGRDSFVPAGAMCLTRPHAGPGTPFYQDAPAGLRTSLAAFDGGREGELASVLKSARKEDAFTLWHLLRRTENDGRARVYAELARLQPPPKGVTEAGVRRGDPAMLDAWWDQLGLGDSAWWRTWKTRLPETRH